ncbi:MAG: flagellar basal body-associated FliL family protein [Planctomycetota bacterium]
MADEADKKRSENSESPGSDGRSRKNLVAFVGSVLFCVGSSVAVGILAFPDAGTDKNAIAEHHPVVRETFELPVPQILVNVVGAGQHALLQATITLEIELGGKKGEEDDINKLLPRVQDQLIKILSSMDERSLTGGASKEFVQTRIKDHINEGIFAGTTRRVVDVFFLEFVLQ